MERRIYHYISLLLLICFSVSSCREIEIETLDDSMYIELNVSCVNLSETRATTDNDNTLNENKIETLHYFLYPTGKTNQNAVLAGKFESSQLIDSKIQIQINEGILNDELIPYPNITCEVFLVANLPSDVTINTSTRENTSLPELEAKVITTDFTITNTDGTFKPQSSFVMTGKNTASLLSRKKANAVQGTIELKRLAAKYTVRISVDETFTDNNKENWIADVANMRVHVANAVNKTKLSGDFGTDYFNYEDREHDDHPVTEKNKTKYVFDPFYSYPCQWDLRGDNAFALFVMLPWKKEGTTGEFTPYYYKVLPNTTQLDRNCWYNVDLHIGVLGSINQTEADVTLTGTYSVMDWNNGSTEWSTGVDESTSIQGAQYLIVDKNEYVVNNQDEFEIPFRTSHPCKIKNLTITRTVFGDSNDDKPEESPITTSEVTNIHYQIGSNANDWLKVEGNTIKLRHMLKNDFINTKDYDYSPYTITFTLCHINNEQKFYENITITQKPAISITAEKNSGTGDTYNGYQFVNGYAAVSSNTYTYGGAVGLTGQTKNPYMYIIEVSVLPEGSDYILGDPRSDTPATPTNTQGLDFEHFTGNVPGIESEGKAQRPNRKLQNYYGTKKDVSVENMIAPKFRIASSHSTVSSFITYNNAFNRSATYQEDGFPAGRWRVPTLAEIRFVTQLFVDGKIPPLFSETVDYWCANARVDVDNNEVKVNYNLESTTRDQISVRPVYDEWYWEHIKLQLTNKNQFTWGDEYSPGNAN